MSGDLHERLMAVRGQVRPNWTPDRQREVWIVLARLRQQRRRTRALVLGSAAAVLLALWAFLGRPPRPGASEQAALPRQAESAAPLLLRIPDGSTVSALSADAAARLEASEGDPSAVVVRLSRGSAHFEVTPRQHPFRVLAGNVTVTVVGTSFVVGMRESEVHISVERGRVRVSWSGGERELGPGQEQLVPQPEPPVDPIGGRITAPFPSQDWGSRPPKSATPSWRALAHDGEYAKAFEVMSAAGKAGVRDDAGDLLLAADVARLSGHPEGAVSVLERVVSRHASDARAPLAAFTLGRVLLDQLGQPHDAAQAFATVRRLSPDGALAQDALAREVESWSRAGAIDLARTRAEEFVNRYPQSRRGMLVRRLGGLDL